MNYEDVYKKLNIDVNNLPTNYNPNDYGRRLMAGYKKDKGVSYAVSTSSERTAKITY